MPMIRRVGRPGLIGMAARTAVVAGTATAVSGNVQRRQDQRAQAEAAQAQAVQAQAAQAQAVQAQQAAAPDAAPDVTAQLQQLAALHAQGVLTDAEFSAAKAKLLG
jgi:type II secretory pathway pseudopilin PulG